MIALDDALADVTRVGFDTVPIIYPDALQVAVAKTANCQIFLTNDKALKRVADVDVLVLDELELKQEDGTDKG